MDKILKRPVWCNRNSHTECATRTSAANIETFILMHGSTAMKQHSCWVISSTCCISRIFTNQIQWVFCIWQNYGLIKQAPWQSRTILVICI